MKNRIKLHFCQVTPYNIGDWLSPVLVNYFYKKGGVEEVSSKEKGKLLGCGSIIDSLKEGDIVWGTGSIRDKKRKSPKDVQYVAVRGPLTKERQIGGDIPDVFGDPVLLMPIVYNPKITVKNKIGKFPRWNDKREGWKKIKGIDINIRNKDWKDTINKILSCQVIMTSSLHGIVLADAYNIPVIWIETYLPDGYGGIMGGEFKFQDYFLGTRRERQKPSTFKEIRVVPNIKNLKEIQKGLIVAFNKIDFNKICLAQKTLQGVKRSTEKEDF